jgi:hypothetical protein
LHVRFIYGAFKKSYKSLPLRGIESSV